MSEVVRVLMKSERGKVELLSLFSITAMERWCGGGRCL